MNVTTSPGFRFGWQGTSVDYVVKAEGAAEVRLPEKSLPGVKAHITDVRRTADGVEARIRVDMRESSFV